MKKPLFGAFNRPNRDWQDQFDGHDGDHNGHEHTLGPIQTVGTPMRHYSTDEEVDYVIVGVGSAGGVLLQRLAKAGFRVVGFDAGPFWDTERDWVSDEAGSHNLYWNDLRITGGSDPLAFGANNSGKGVGGGSIHWAGFTPRFHPSDFRVYSEDGVGADWPISYDDVRPYYELLEREIPVSGPANYPWGDPHGYPYGPHPLGGVGDVLVKGCTRLGIRVVAGGPVAINAGSHGDRPHCIYRGFCIQGCKVGAKQSTLVSHVPDAIRHGAEIRANSMVSRITMGKDGRVTGVSYFDPAGNERHQRANVVIVSGYAIETPRLLLNSACPGFEQGLANSSGTVGKYLMAQAGNVILGRFAEPVRMYKAPPAHALTEEFYETDASRGFARGFAIQTVGPLPIAFAKQMMVAKGAWGWGMRRVMMDYNHWAALGLLGEILPWEGNRVELADETDQHGLRVAKVTFDLHDNDKKLIEFGKNKVMEVMYAAGAEEVVQEPRYAHLIGGARMGNDARTSVVDSFGRTHDIANLFLCDGSIFPTQGSANPGLTIQALAARTADYLIAEGAHVRSRPARHTPVDAPPIRYDLSPRGTSGRGVPRIRSRRNGITIGFGGLTGEVKGNGFMSDDQKVKQQQEAQGQKPGIKHGSASGISDIHDAVTTKYNQVFMLTDQQGDILPDDHGFGLYFRDMRYLNQIELRLGQQHAISLLADARKGSESVFELTNPLMKLSNGQTLPKERLSIRRSYTLHRGVKQCIAIRNLDRQDVAFDMALTFGSDFDDMLVIRGFLPGQEKRGTVHPPQLKGKELVLAYEGADKHHRSTTITFSPSPDESADDTTVIYHLCLEPGQTKTIEISIELADAGPHGNHLPGGHQNTHSGSEKHMEFDKMLAVHPQFETSNALFDRALQRSLQDVRLLATANGDDIFVTAGIPWYVALFGRDTCVTAFETLAFQPELARSTLDLLARYQGTRYNTFQDEEPGKILHELRVGEAANLHEVPMIPYYGTVDATPWFLMLAAEYVRWTGDVDFFHQLRDNINRALDWIDENEKEHLQGFLTYGSKSEKGLINQGWKDSDNGVVNEDGSLVEPPVALVEVQGYAYRARRDIADILRMIGDDDSARTLEKKAEALKRRFNESFWMDDAGFYGFALQRGGRLSRAIASNPGQTLFTGIVTEERARKIANRLMQDDLFCGWGIRTLSEQEAAYNPLDYQVGSVWPHDNALIALGMRCWGETDHLDRIFTGIYEAATQFTDFRLPEVFDGFSLNQYTRPVKYPVACSPQAWAAGTLPLLLQSALGLQPHAIRKMLYIHRPHLPQWLGDVTVRSLRVGNATIDLRYSREGDTTLVAVLKREGDIVVQVEY